MNRPTYVLARFLIRFFFVRRESSLRVFDIAWKRLPFFYYFFCRLLLHLQRNAIVFAFLRVAISFLSILCGVGSAAMRTSPNAQCSLMTIFMAKMCHLVSASVAE